jgi:DNA-binding NarL/FixJ family response regulator
MDQYVPRGGGSSEKETVIDQRSSAAPAACVLAVDDQAHALDALRDLVGATSALELVGEAESGEAAVALVTELKPDLVLMDVRMPGIGGINASVAIKEMRPETVVVLASTIHPGDLGLESDESRADEIVWKGDLRPRVLDEIWARRGKSGATKTDGAGPSASVR